MHVPHTFSFSIFQAFSIQAVDQQAKKLEMFMNLRLSLPRMISLSAHNVQQGILPQTLPIFFPPNSAHFDVFPRHCFSGLLLSGAVMQQQFILGFNKHSQACPSVNQLFFFLC